MVKKKIETSDDSLDLPGNEAELEQAIEALRHACALRAPSTPLWPCKKH